MGWTCASERTIKNWLDGSHGPRGEHIIEVIRPSDAIYSSCCDWPAANTRSP
jgi:hypothetical protein